ncbi:hypothetical protein F4805DRAFT_47195 [Annulohypoxylon moriforme]|nr:hypothetical protein F4805DRAFT_47195 [Annulohypoxylon moriforme]
MSTTPTFASSVLHVPSATSPFSPAPFCTQDIYYVVHQDMSCHYPNGSTVACRQFHLGPTTSTSACFPTSWSPSEKAFISPGVCPLGYTIACKTTGEPEKIATCCPSGFSCQKKGDGWRWISTDLCRQSMPHSITYQYTTTTPGKTPETTTTTGGNTLNAYGVAIKWHEADLAAATAATIPTPTTITRSPTNDSAITNPSFNGLPPDAKVGVGAGVAVAGILLLVGGLFLWKRWPKRHPKGGTTIVYDLQPVEQPPPAPQPPGEPTELIGNGATSTNGLILPTNHYTGRAELSCR